jgi:NAD(P)-dependent dehydrogenase (short-subunit alcohol dehydrogenase family)
VGAAVAAEATASGASALFLIDKNADLGNVIAEELSVGSARVAFHAADLGETGAASAAMAAAIARFGRVDHLVNAAGITDRASILDGTPELWDRLFAINARAAFFTMQSTIADMRNRRAAGSIVNILSMNAHCGAPDLAIYAATKGALATLTKNAANAHLSDCIRVNGVNMGWAATPAEQQMQADTLGHGPDWADRVASDLPLGRMLTTREVADLVVFLLSDASGLMTGTLIDMEQRVTGAL